MSRPQTKVYHDLWNRHHPEDLKIDGDGYVIHHIDGNPFNNDIMNLKKMTKAEHTKLHQTGVSRIMPESQRIKTSQRQKGKGNSFYGKKHSIETREHLSKVRTGRHPSEETIKKLSIANTGKKRTLETRIKISKARIGIKTFLGRKHTDEAKRKVSEANKGRVPWNKGMKNANKK